MLKKSSTTGFLALMQGLRGIPPDRLVPQVFTEQLMLD